VNTNVPRYWEHFYHQADIGIRGLGQSKEEAFEQAALALTAVITELNSLNPKHFVTVACDAPDDELLLVDWLNAIIYQMAIRRMVFGRFEVRLTGTHLEGSLWGEEVDIAKHRPAVEIKGATYTELRVEQRPDGNWIAQCVVDV